MRLPDFILENIEPILLEWEAFARSIWPGPATDPLTLRDHGDDILKATARDMKSVQTASQQEEKSKGEGQACQNSNRVNGASDVHAVERVRSGFDVLAVVSEYRALRASVIRLWRESSPLTDLRDLDDLTRFNESIDQSLTEAVRSYTVRVDRSRQMFLAILGHDLRNPLTSVIMSGQMLAEPGRVDPKSADLASHIAASGNAMKRMIGDLLDFTGNGLGAAMPVSPVRMNLNALCEEVVEEIRAAHPHRNIHFQSHGDLHGDWDAGRLRQMVSNLLGNAVQHGDPSTAVDLSATSDGGDVLMNFHNDGAPIDPSALGTIFDPLVRGSAIESESDRETGSIGLGLYIAREVAVAHGGSIVVTSSTEEGTTFCVRLPRHRAGY